MAFEGCKSQDKLHELMDQAASLELMEATTLEVAADAVESKFGVRPGIATLSRLQNGVSVLPIYGLRETEIARTFYTPSHIAQDAQLAELRLRVAKFRGKDMEPEIVKAGDTLADLNERLKDRQALLERARIRDAAREAERRLDQASVASLSQQIKLYLAGLAKATNFRRRLMVEASSLGLSALTVLKDVFTFGAGERADLIILARTAINTLFPNYALDLMDADVQLSRSRNFAELYGTHAMFIAAFDCAAATRDPRLAHYFAELAVLRPHGPVAFRATNVKAERPDPHPVVTSARLLYMSKRLDDHEATPIKLWKPRWLEGRISQLDEAQALIELAEQGT